VIIDKIVCRLLNFHDELPLFGVFINLTSASNVC
jgi:hypothetical protein